MKKSVILRLSKKLKALQDPTRLKILAILSQGPFCVCIITEVLKLAQPTISRHLSLLEDAGFVSRRREGRLIIYRLSPEDRLTENILGPVLSEVLKDPECDLLFNAIETMKKGGAFPLVGFYYKE